MKQAVRWSSGAIIVRSALVEDELAAQLIERAVRDAHPNEQSGFWLQFGRMCAQTESSEGLDWKPENVRAMPANEVRAAYEKFLKMPRALWDRWIEALSNTEEIKDIVIGPYPLPEYTDPNSESAVSNSRKT